MKWTTSFPNQEDDHIMTQYNSLVSEHYTKVKGLWDELFFYRQIPDCSCGSLKILLEYQQQEQILQFLMRLNESFAHIMG